DAAPLIANVLGIAGSNVAWNQIAEARVPALEIIIAIFFRNLGGTTFFSLVLRHPDAAVVAQRFAHQSELRLVLSGNRDTGRMNLRVTGISEQRAAFVSSPDRGSVRSLRIRRKI